MRLTSTTVLLRATLTLAVILIAGITATGQALAQDPAGTANAIPPFTLSYTGASVPGSPAEVELQSIRLSGVNPTSEAWTVGCQRCLGGGHLSNWRHVTGEGWVSTVRGRTVMDSQSILLEAVTSPGLVGRFKVYSVRPPASLLAIETEGCVSPTQQVISPDFPAHISQIDQVPCSGLLLPAQGSEVQPSDAVTVTFRTPKRLPPGESWVLAVQAAASQPGCVQFDAAFLPGSAPTGTLLTATLSPTDSLAVPAPLSQWCTGQFTIAAFTSAGRGKTVHKIAQRIDDFAVS